MFVMSLALVGITFLLSLYMQFVRGFTALQTGVRLLPLAERSFLAPGLRTNSSRDFGTKADPYTADLLGQRP